MSYLVLEGSEQDAQPVELFKIQTTTQRFLYCNLEVEVSFNGDVYQPEQVKRGGLSDSYDLEDGTMSLWTSRDSTIADFFKQGMPADLPLVTVYRGHLVGDSLTLLPENSVTLFNGKVANPSFGESELKLECTSLALALSSVGLRRKFSGNCPHILYRGACGVQRVAYTVYAKVTGIAGEVISTDMPAKPDGYYRAGLVVHQGSFMMVTNYTGNQNLTLLAPILGLKVGDTIEVSAGCDKSKETCKARFENISRYGGFTQIPTVNYFTSGIT